jgi:hypothetical protein
LKACITPAVKLIWTGGDHPGDGQRRNDEHDEDHRVPIRVPPDPNLATSAGPSEQSRTPPQNRTMTTAL